MNPTKARFDRTGNLFFVERANHVVRRVEAADQTISTVAGNGRAGFSGDDGQATQASLNQPHSIQLDPYGNLFICDIGNHRIRRVDAQDRNHLHFCRNRRAGSDGWTAHPSKGPL